MKSLRIAFVLLVFALFIFGCGGEKPDEATPPAEQPAETPAAKPADTQPSGPVATVTGTVTFEGQAPSLQLLDMGAEPTCAAKHEEPPRSQALVLGDGNTMAYVFVKVKSGLPAGKTYAAPSEPVVLDQNGCVYEPHVFGVMVDQPIRILNSDGILHNVHPQPAVNRSVNFAMPRTLTEKMHTFKKAEPEPFSIKCDVHPWMLAYAAVMPHPFYSVTQKDGKFTISGLEGGTYEIEAWHERLGTQTASVTVAAGESQTVDFVFKR